MKYLHLASAGLLRHKLRTTLTLLTISSAFLLFGLIGSVNNAMTHVANNAVSAHRLITFPQSSGSPNLPVTLEAGILAVPGVKAVTFNHNFWGIYQNPNNVVGGFAVPRNYFALFPEYRCPPLGWRKFSDTRMGAIVGAKLAAQYHWRIGEQIPIEASGYTRRDGSDTWTFDVECIDHARPRNFQNAIFFHWNYFKLSVAKHDVGATAFIEKIGDPLNANEISLSIDLLSQNSAHQTKTESANAMIVAKVRQAIDLKLVTIALMSAVFFTLLIVTGSAIIQSAIARTPEFAVLKALGISSIRLVTNILTETALLYFIGGVLGLTIASISGAEILNLFRDFIDPLVGSPGRMETAGLWLRGTGLMALFSVIIGMLAARRVVFLRIADALAER